MLDIDEISEIIEILNNSIMSNEIACSEKKITLKNYCNYVILMGLYDLICFVKKTAQNNKTNTKIKFKDSRTVQELNFNINIDLNTNEKHLQQVFKEGKISMDQYTEIMLKYFDLLSCGCGETVYTQH